MFLAKIFECETVQKMLFSYTFLLWTEIWIVSHSNILARNKNFMGHTIFISEKQIDTKNKEKDIPIAIGKSQNVLRSKATPTYNARHVGFRMLFSPHKILTAKNNQRKN